MPKNKLLGDLDELLAKSQRLTSNVSTGGLVIGGLGTDFVRGVFLVNFTLFKIHYHTVLGENNRFQSYEKLQKTYRESILMKVAH